MFSANYAFRLLFGLILFHALPLHLICFVVVVVFFFTFISFLFISLLKGIVVVIVCFYSFSKISPTARVFRVLLVVSHCTCVNYARRFSSFFFSIFVCIAAGVCVCVFFSSFSSMKSHHINSL